MAQAMEKLDSDAKAVQIYSDAFIKGFALPAIAHIIRDDGTTHYVVICRIKGTGRHR